MNVRIIEAKIKNLAELAETQRHESLVQTDPYLMGFANGLILALSIFTELEPKFISVKNQGEK